MKSTITEIKNIPEGSNSRIDDTEEWISEQEDRAVAITQTDQKKRKIRGQFKRPLRQH